MHPSMLVIITSLCCKRQNSVCVTAVHITKLFRVVWGGRGKPHTFYGNISQLLQGNSIYLSTTPSQFQETSKLGNAFAPLRLQIKSHRFQFLWKLIIRTGKHVTFCETPNKTTTQYLTIRFPSAKMTYYGLRISEYRAFYNGLKSKVGLAADKAAALQVNLNVQGCSIVAPPMHAPSRTPPLPLLLLSHNLPTPRVH
jgi:hypothetical protein